MAKKKLRCIDYHVAWICAVESIELRPALLMLDEEHDSPTYDTRYDDNIYITGSLAGHNIVMICCPPGLTGNVNATRMTKSLFDTFPNIKMTVLVGIGGGIPHKTPPDKATENIHLGDVVVGWPGDGLPACIQYDHGRWHDQGQFETLGTINRPDRALLNAFGILKHRHKSNKASLEKHRQRLLQSEDGSDFARPDSKTDRLYKASYTHKGEYGTTCDTCDVNQIVKRPQRTAEELDIVFHFGRIATGDSVVQDGRRRDEIRDLTHGALCIEMEAAGVDASGNCLVIRGISDYSDSHKNDVWKSYAAGNAAVFARELLSNIPPQTVEKVPFIVPFPRNKYFSGREDAMKALEQCRLDLSSPMAQRVAVSGLGGCGKSALAIEFAYHFQQQEPTSPVFWVPAYTRQAFEQGYRDIGEALGIPMTAGGSEKNKIDVKQVIRDRLDSHDHKRWLMIVDSADDEHILFDGAGDEILVDYLPSHQGLILFTTRTSKTAYDLADTRIELKELSQIEAPEFLSKRLGDTLLNDEGTVQLFLETLAYLPLAIVQAAAYITRNKISLQEYTNLYHQSREDSVFLLSKEHRDRSRYNHADNAVITTWFISFLQIRQHERLAADYLTFMACIDRGNIPSSILPPAKPASRMTEAIGTLKAYEFVTERVRRIQEDTSDRMMYDMHRLVHLATQEWMRSEHTLNSRIEEVVERLVDVIPKHDVSMWRTWSDYLVHGLHVAKFSGAQHPLGNKRGRLLDKVVFGYMFMGQLMAAEEAQREMLMFCETHLQRTYRVRSFLGWILTQQGKPAEGEKILREVLQETWPILGEGDSTVLEAMSNLAEALGSQGKYLKAKEMQEIVLGRHRQVLGPDDLDTRLHMHRLGKTLFDLGDFKEAARILLEVHQSDCRAMGVENPGTLTSLSDLGLALGKQGEYAEAENVLGEAWRLRQKVLGSDHPSTTMSKANLAGVLVDQGKIEVAERMCHEAVEAFNKSLGEEHPHTVAAMTNLQRCLRTRGGLESPRRQAEQQNQHRYEETETMLQGSLALANKVLGGKHPETLEIMNYLGNTLHLQNKLDEAEEMHRLTLALRKEVLGEEHLHTLDSMSKLVEVLSDQEKSEEAVQLQQSVFELSQRILGEEDPSTLLHAFDLGRVLVQQGRLKEAEQTYLAVIPLIQERLGQDREYALECIRYLGEALADGEKYEEAKKILTDNLVLTQKVLGKKHAATLANMNSLGIVLFHQGKYGEARDMLQTSVDLGEKNQGQESTTLKSLEHVQGEINRPRKKQRKS